MCREEGCSVHCRWFSYIPDLDPLESSSSLSKKSVITKISSDMVNYFCGTQNCHPLWVKTTALLMFPGCISQINYWPRYPCLWICFQRTSTHTGELSRTQRGYRGQWWENNVSLKQDNLNLRWGWDDRKSWIWDTKKDSIDGTRSLSVCEEWGKGRHVVRPWWCHSVTGNLEVRAGWENKLCGGFQWICGKWRCWIPFCISVKSRMEMSPCP